MGDSVFSALTGGWSFSPQIVIIVVAFAILYWRGAAGTTALLPDGHRLRSRPWRMCCFQGSLLLVLVALQSPLDSQALSLMWVHMIQHLLLIMVVAPLALLGDPVMPLLRGIPLGFRRWALSAVLGWRWARLLGRGLGWLARLAPALVVFTSSFYAWHVPALYNLTLRNQVAHDLEHATFLAAGILLWWQVIDQTAARCRLGWGGRALYMFLAAVENHLLALVLSLSTVPLYAYSLLARRPGQISALTDQQIAGGIMWVPGMILFGSAFSYFLYKWLSTQPRLTIEQVPALVKAAQADHLA